MIKELQTYTATISIGFREQYTDNCHMISEVKEICQEYCNTIGLCVTVTSTHFIYKNGNEDGCFIGLINYPRFPSLPEDIVTKAINLATILKERLNQLRVSVICSDMTYMLENEEEHV
jgi:hypothetical protein